MMNGLYGRQRGYTLLEVVFVLIFITLSVIGSLYYIHYEKSFSTADLIAKQFNYIADSVIKYDWVAPDSVEGDESEYTIEQLIKKGVLSGNKKYILDYGVRLYWNNKNSYTLLIYIRTPVSFSLDDLTSISSLIGPDGGYVNNNGEIVVSSSRIWNNIISKNKLGIEHNTPVFIKQVRIVIDLRKKESMIIGEKFIEAGVSRSNKFFSNNKPDVVTWKPVFVDDEMTLSWPAKNKFTAIVKDAFTDEVLYKEEKWGDSFSLYPKQSWLLKKLMLQITIYDGIYLVEIKRFYYLSATGVSSLKTEFSVDGYTVLPNSNILKKTSLSAPVNLRNGFPFIACINNISFSINGNGSEHWLLVPVTVKILGKSNKGKALAVYSYNIKKIPFSFKRKDHITYDSIKNGCVFFSEDTGKTKIDFDTFIYHMMLARTATFKGTISNSTGGHIVINWY